MLVFMIVTLYSVAILCTRVIGHGNIIGEDADEDLQKIKDLRRLSCRNMNICIDCVHSARSSGGMCFFEHTWQNTILLPGYHTITMPGSSMQALSDATKKQH